MVAEESEVGRKEDLVRTEKLGTRLDIYVMATTVAPGFLAGTAG